MKRVSVAVKTKTKVNEQMVSTAKDRIIDAQVSAADLYRLAGTASSDIMKQAASDLVELMSAFSHLSDPELEEKAQEFDHPDEVYIADLLLSERSKPEEGDY